ncbi:MAG: hypothetical protein WDO17_00555 [Alphaproteobacteria bacterium]
MPKHLSLAERKALIGRHSAFESFDALSVYDDDKRLGVVLDEMVKRSNEALVAQQNTEPLDQWFRTQTKYISDHLTGLSSIPATVTMQDMASALAKRSAEVSCATCAGGKICNGSMRDDAIVTEGGSCIAPFMLIFREAERIANAYYRVFAGVGDIEVSFSTGLLAPGASVGRVRVNGAATPYDKSKQERRSAVELVLDVGAFDWQSYLACLYVLLHECICHAFAGLQGTKKRPTLQEYDAFTEGWMDWIVSMVLDDLKRGTAPTSRESASALPHLQAMCTTGSFVHGERVDPKTAPASLVRGVSAASKTYDFLKSRCSPEEAQHMMYRLSFGLNSLDLNEFTVTKKFDLCRTLAQNLASGVEYYRPGRARAEGALTRYVERHQDCYRFLVELF